ncbi:MAG: hypothetical protein QHH15_07965, partial [Candidatus Thermoplasmatota archaeon]|nr:hypothetical protein [Candidatus Thermoplasmatota archaeon]
MITKKKHLTILIASLFLLLNISTIQAQTYSTLPQKNIDTQNIEKQVNNNLETFDTIKISFNNFSNSFKTLNALILNPLENIYGNKHCQKIINKLIEKGYTTEYLSNEAVDLTFIKNNLTAEIVYLNTHAGYFDLDNDNIPETVVISTGEQWTDETPVKYQFEYVNQMIVEGRVGNKSFIAFTPALINYYYNDGDFPDTLVYMATCYATYDDSMAQVFLNKGASAYMGWNQNTVFWTNSMTSVIAFSFFVKGFTVKQVCNIIKS